MGATPTLAGYLCAFGSGVCIHPVDCPIAATLVIAIIIGEQFHVVSEPVRVVAFDIRKVEKNLIVVPGIVTYLFVSQVHIAGCPTSIEMTRHIDKLHTWEILLQLIHPVEIGIDLFRRAIHLTTPGPHYNIPVITLLIEKSSRQFRPRGSVRVSEVSRGHSII
jgi:hypothetical protein